MMLPRTYNGMQCDENGLYMRVPKKKRDHRLFRVKNGNSIRQKKRKMEALLYAVTNSSLTPEDDGGDETAQVVIRASNLFRR